MKKLILIFFLFHPVAFAEKVYDDIGYKFGQHSAKLIHICSSLEYLKKDICPEIMLKETNVNLCIGYATILFPKEHQKKAMKELQEFYHKSKDIFEKQTDMQFLEMYKANKRIEEKKRRKATCNEIEKILEGEITKQLSILKGIDLTKVEKW